MASTRKARDDNYILLVVARHDWLAALLAAPCTSCPSSAHQPSGLEHTDNSIFAGTIARDDTIAAWSHKHFCTSRPSNAHQLFWVPSTNCVNVRNINFVRTSGGEGIKGGVRGNGCNFQSLALYLQAGLVRPTRSSRRAGWIFSVRLFFINHAFFCKMAGGPSDLLGKNSSRRINSDSFINSVTRDATPQSPPFPYSLHGECRSHSRVGVQLRR